MFPKDGVRNCGMPRIIRSGRFRKYLVDPQNGVVRFVVVEVDKEWSFDDPAVAVPWSALDVKTEQGDKLRVTLNATKEKLQRAPRYMEGDANRLYSQETAEPIYEYWDVLWLDVSQTQSSQPAAEGSPTPQTPGSSSSRPSAASPTMSPMASPASAGGDADSESNSTPSMSPTPATETTPSEILPRE